MLINERWFEVRKLIPKTIGQLGAEGRELFQYYANHKWPSGHRRHPQDAMGFLRFLKTNRICKPPSSEIAKVDASTR